MFGQPTDSPSAARDAARKDSLNYGAKGSLRSNERRVSISINESA